MIETIVDINLHKCYPTENGCCKPLNRWKRSINHLLGSCQSFSAISQPLTLVDGGTWVPKHVAWWCCDSWRNKKLSRTVIICRYESDRNKSSNPIIHSSTSDYQKIIFLTYPSFYSCYCTHIRCTLYHPLWKWRRKTHAIGFVTLVAIFCNVKFHQLPTSLPS